MSADSENTLEVNQVKTIRNTEVFRYIANGVVATVVHYAVLTFNINVVSIESAGIANFIASVFGISVSFIGNRYIVFKKIEETLISQASKFAALYIIIAVIHGLVLYVWSDVYKLNYNYGFVIAVTIQFVLGYLGKKFSIWNAELT